MGRPAPAIEQPQIVGLGRGAEIARLMSVLAPNAQTRGQLKGEVAEKLSRILAKVPLDFSLEEDSGSSQGFYLLLVAETASGSRLGSDNLFERRLSKSESRKGASAQREISGHVE